jgi:hypothetical protein
MAQTKQSQSPQRDTPAPPSPGASVDRQEAIRARAHAIWEHEGQPEGRHEDHWAQAERDHDQSAGGS